MKHASVIVYATQFCPYCQAARTLLTQKGIQWTEIAIDENPELFQEMIRLSGKTSVPQIFIGNCHVGGYDDMAALDREGRLDPLLFPET